MVEYFVKNMNLEFIHKRNNSMTLVHLNEKLCEFHLPQIFVRYLDKIKIYSNESAELHSTMDIQKIKSPSPLTKQISLLNKVDPVWSLFFESTT
jgi:hypothetical protein